MTKQRMRNTISKKLGFMVSKITVDSMSYESGEFAHFTVCGVKYAIEFDHTEGTFELFFVDDTNRSKNRKED